MQRTVEDVIKQALDYLKMQLEIGVKYKDNGLLKFEVKGQFMIPIWVKDGTFHVLRDQVEWYNNEVSGAVFRGIEGA